MINLTQGQVDALQGLALFVMEIGETFQDEGQPLPPMDEIMAPMLLALDIPEEDWIDACAITYGQMEFLISEYETHENN